MVRLKSQIVIVVVLALALIGAGTASAKYGRGLPSAYTRSHHLDVSGSSVTSAASAHGQVAQKDGFDWGDAGIGAGGALALTALVAGGVVMVARTRRDGRHRSVPTTT